MDEARKIGHELAAYLESEMADEKNNNFDSLWQSIYDVCKLATYQIIELEDKEIEAAVTWLKEYQHYTKDYQDFEFEF